MKVNTVRKSVKKTSVSLDRSLYLLHPYNSCLITSKGKTGKANIMTVAWIIPISVDPPWLGMSIRPQRHSYNLILESGEFVVNVPTFNLANQVLFCGRRSGKEHDKFRETSLKAMRAKKVNAPAIAECVGHLECRLVKTLELGDHMLVIGEIIKAYATDGYFDQIYDITKFQPCLHLGKNFFTTCVKKRKEPKLKAS